MIEKSMIMLYSINGELLHKIPLQNSGTLDFSSYPDGAYLIQVGQEANFVKSFQIIKISK
jgi:hypothetical protein